MAWTVRWAVEIDDLDVSEPMAPYLIDIEVSDREGMSSDTASLTLDDREGQLKLPKAGKKMTVALDGATVFRGVVDIVRSSGARGGGRLLKVAAKGFDTRGKAKEAQFFHVDDAPLGDFLAEAAKRAGFALKIDPVLSAVKRAYWAVDGESFAALGERIAREFNATFKLRDDKAVLVQRGADHLPAVSGVVGPGGNVINWDIAPITGRGRFARAEVRWFDRAEAKFKSEAVEIEGEGAEAANVTRVPAADAEQARAMAEGRAGESERNAGEGSVELDLTPSAQAEAPFTIIGARPGVDGSYRITGVTHRANRGGGATTRIEVKQPGGGAGQDARGDNSAGDDGESTNLAAVSGLG